jgi:hypothetical protein
MIGAAVEVTRHPSDASRGRGTDTEGSRDVQLEVTMRKLLMAIAAFAALAFMSGQALAIDAGTASKLSGAIGTQGSVLHLAGYKHCDYSGCYSCSRHCDSYGYNYGHRYCRHYSYYDCSPYRYGGYGKRRYYGGGGGGY